MKGILCVVLINEGRITREKYSKAVLIKIYFPTELSLCAQFTYVTNYTYLNLIQLT